MSYLERLKKIRVVILDVDGVLTDGRLGYGAAEVIKFFHARDGHWIKLALRAGLKIGVITGREDGATRRRMTELGVSFFREKCFDKVAAFGEVLTEQGVTPEECLYVGDEVVDMPVMRRCGVAVAVADGMAELDEVADFRTTAPGGCGAVCEVLHLLLREQGKLDAIMERYRQ